MSKQQRQIRQTNIQRAGAVGNHIEQTDVYEDNLLPDAAEIEKLHQIDPTIMEWLKTRAEKEQEFRHTFSKDRLLIVRKNEGNYRACNIIGLISAFLLFVAAMAFSYALIIHGYPTRGSIFGGATILLTITVFVGKRVREMSANKMQHKP